MNDKLLKFMYMEGYSSDDTYDDVKIEEAKHKMIFEKIKKAVVACFDAVKKVVKDLWEQIKPIVNGWEVEGSPQRRNELQLQGIKKVRDQVMDRKPRYSPVKIIGKN